MFKEEKLQPCNNRLLAALPPDQFEQLHPFLEKVHLPGGRVLFDVGDRVNHAYFVNSGVVSLLSLTADGDTVEMAMVGREGLVGVTSALWGDKSLWHARMQIAGSAFRIRAERLRTEVARNGMLSKLVHGYAHTMLAQISQGFACNTLHSMDQRLARWLLITHDIAGSSSFAFTHQSISEMLGVSRSRVSMAAGILKQEGLIRYIRGRIAVLDRDRLEDASCECYQVIRDEIDSFLASQYLSTTCVPG